jgi:hypothetical protein
VAPDTEDSDVVHEKLVEEEKKPTAERATADEWRRNAEDGVKKKGDSESDEELEAFQNDGKKRPAPMKRKKKPLTAKKPMKKEQLGK